jgi:hypothetical protein
MKFLERFYKWLIDEEFDFDIILECNYFDIIKDLKEKNLYDPIYGYIFWECFKGNIRDYLKYGLISNI